MCTYVHICACTHAHTRHTHTRAQTHTHTQSYIFKMCNYWAIAFSIIFYFIGSLSRSAFNTLGESLLRLDLSGNELSYMEDGALSDVQHLLFLNISHNSLSRFNSDVFKGKIFIYLIVLNSMQISFLYAKHFLFTNWIFILLTFS